VDKLALVKIFALGAALYSFETRPQGLKIDSNLMAMALRQIDHRHANGDERHTKPRG
jgi:hypothetical protein